MKNFIRFFKDFQLNEEYDDDSDLYPLRDIYSEEDWVNDFLYNPTKFKNDISKKKIYKNLKPSISYEYKEGDEVVYLKNENDKWLEEATIFSVIDNDRFIIVFEDDTMLNVRRSEIAIKK